jgi:hypothetical protein
MRIAKLVLPIAAALALAATAAAANPSSGAYPWAQPGTTAVVNPFAQMPAWLTVVPAVPTPPVDRGYAWAQPGSAPVDVPFAQPWTL